MKARNVLLWSSVIVNIGLLGVFKYYNFFHNINGLDQWLYLASFIPKYCVAKLFRLFVSGSVEPIYRKEVFNKYGDVDVHWKMPSRVVKVELLSDSIKVNPRVGAQLKVFKEELEQKGISVSIMPPVYQENTYLLNKKVVGRIIQSMSNIGLHLSAKPERYALPDSMFFDSVYHLNGKGVDVRTGLMIEDMRNSIECFKGKSVIDNKAREVEK